MPDRALRLGDVIDDYCPRCRLLLNHDVATMTDGKVAKVTCRTCYNTHDYRNAQVPARRKAKKDDDKTPHGPGAGEHAAAPRPPRAAARPGARSAATSGPRSSA